MLDVEPLLLGPGSPPSLLSSPLLSSPLVLSRLLSSPLVSSPLLSPPLVSSRLLSSPLPSSRLLSSSLLSSPLLSSPLVSSPLLSPPLVSSRLLSSPLVSSRLLSSPLVSSPNSSPLSPSSLPPPRSLARSLRTLLRAACLLPSADHSVRRPHLLRRAAEPLILILIAPSMETSFSPPPSPDLDSLFSLVMAPPTPSSLLVLAVAGCTLVATAYFARHWITNAKSSPPSPLPQDEKKEDEKEMLVLPPDARLTYLAEGAANIIYRIAFPAGSLTPPIFSNRLLRLRKQLPSAQPNALAFRYLSTTAFPLFPPSLLVETTLIRVPTSTLATLNAGLRGLEASSSRPKKRHGLYLEEDERYGFLITDMSPHRSPSTPLSPQVPNAAVGTGGMQRTREILVEFKPKWVLQSPSAPKDWTRCRTCALRLQKAAAKHSPTSDGFCPLDLSSGKPDRIRRAVRKLLPRSAPAGFELREAGWEHERDRLEGLVVRYLARSGLMRVLKGLQGRLDKLGPLNADCREEGYLTSMTVRDLTVFLKVDMNIDEEDAEEDAGEDADEVFRLEDDGVRGHGIEARIGDLDLKVAGHGKAEYWKETERVLVEEGWYTGEQGDEEVRCEP